MKNKNTVKQMVTMMERNGETPHYIIGWLMSMIDSKVNTCEGLQYDIDAGVRFYQDKALISGRKAVINSAQASDIINANGKE